ncbi:trehalose-phosphate phosphatase 2 [Pyrus ussuriensis x Pyrus communis]|uniref:Trehalose 6-phosphate phosphatase n=1 Tax=Pyrus ussuriensis x Pyrus communis TaxID=2448454 RepID=A0A5N5G4N6_9ROSA|nr:trehalose-phosphate phosphatase 2 [Pyrus ussuriensis x Pyrus communis]
MGYVEEMESLSKAIRYDDHGEPTVDLYTSWLTKHPSALDAFGQMMSAVKGKDIVVFLDYDGTLSRIVQDPDKAFMTAKMRSAVDEVACCFPTAIISGRRRDKVYDFVKLDNIYYAGSHGMDISTTSGSSKYSYHKHQSRSTDAKGNEYVNFRPAFEFLPTIAKIIKLLKEETKGIKGAVVEDNKFCISVHYRCVKEEVMEIRPKIDWNKGRALQYLLDTPGFCSSTDVLPIYVGDDKTDEDAFEAIRRIGRGFPIVVSSTPKETKALYSLRDPTEVTSFLSCLAAWRKDT